ncbi:putative ribonuclease H-like domain-containing protein [Tanacetum coccineum]
MGPMMLPTVPVAEPCFLAPEWNTHVVVLMNKAEIETMNIDDLYNNFNIVEQSVKKSIGASSGAQNLAFMTAPSTSSTNDVNTAKPTYEVSTVSHNNPKCFKISYKQDLEQIHKDDLEAMNLKWQLSLLSMRAKRYFQRTCKKIFINANDTAGYDKSKVECFNCHKMGHFAREYISPRNKEGQFKYQDNTRKQGNNEGTYSKEMMAIDGVRFDWSDMAEEQVQTNIALMAFSDSELDLSYSGLDEFKEPEFKSYGSEVSKQESNIVCNKKSNDSKENSDDSLVKEQVSKDISSFVESSLNVEKETVFLDKKIEFIKPKNHEKPVKKSVSGCSRNMTGNIAYLLDFKEFDGGYVTFRGGAHGGTRFHFPNESDILLKIPRKDNMYSFDMKNIVPKESVTCLVVKATLDESMLQGKGVPGKQHKAPLFTWGFFLATNDETSEILKNFIKEIENLVDKKVKIIRYDNGTEFNNKVMDDFCREKADSKLPTTFWAEAVSTACYVQNMVLVVKPHNETPYELFRGFKPALSFMRPFGCHVTILNTLDNLGKYDGKSDDGFFVGYSLSIAACTITNESAGTQGELNAGTSIQKEEISQDCIVMPIWKYASYFDSPSKDVGNSEPKYAADDQKQVKDGPDNENDEKDNPEVNTSRFKLNTVDPSVNTASSYDPYSPKYMFKRGASHTLEATHVEFFSDEDEPKVDLGNILNSYTLPTTPNTRIHKDHPIKNVIGKSHDTLNTCLYACFLSQIEPISIAKALSDSSWVEAMQEELLQFKTFATCLDTWDCLLREDGPLEQNGSSGNKRDEKREL